MKDQSYQELRDLLIRELLGDSIDIGGTRARMLLRLIKSKR